MAVFNNKLDCERTFSSLDYTENQQFMRNRDFHKKQAIKHTSQTHCEMYQAERNKVNIEIRNAKSKFFCEKIRDCSHSKI